MFTKVGENHAVRRDLRTGMNTKNSVKPRFICCPKFEVRARIGKIAYFMLKYFKKHFPEFFLGRSPEQLEDELKIMKNFPWTYESDFSAYDSTNS